MLQSRLAQRSIRTAARSAFAACCRSTVYAASATVPRRVLSSAVPSKAQPSTSEGFLNGSAGSYIEEMYSAWLKDPKSVHLSWQVYFRNLAADGKQPAFMPPPTIIPSAELEGYVGDSALSAGDKIPAGEIMDHMKVQLLVRAYQVRGHHLAKLDPLEITGSDESNAPELSHKHYGFEDADLDRKFYLGSGILPAFLAQEGEKSMTLREIIGRLKQTYCGSIGIEYGHIPDRQQCDWLRQRFEVPTKYNYTKEQKMMILDRLMWSDHFERFVATKYPTEKRFGLEGCESLIPGMKSLIDRSVDHGVNSVVMGMPHRGRLNVLSNVVRKPNESIFAEFSHSAEDTVEGSGDVKYHLGMNYMRPTPSGKMVHLSLAANPSHLEAVNPVVEGKVRAIQFYQNDEKDHGKAMAVLLHGDAAFAAQGVVYETLGMADLPAYTTGGTIHVIVNNQVGFTTDPRFARSTPYCSDVAKTVNAPILHVNGDDVEAVVYAMELASEWRAKWKKDVVVDIVCYRRHGHNEIDQPSFTQPLMYQRIAGMTPVLDKYIQQLLAEGSVTQEEVDEMKKRVWGILEENYVASRDYKASSKEWQSSTWTGFKAPAELAAETVPAQKTGIDLDLLRYIGVAAASYPSDFTVHSNLGKILRQREKSVKEGKGIDWATAESMAFGTLLAEGKHVRLSGQDVERGTFSQRHALLNDQKTEATYVPLNHLVAGDLVSSQNTFTVCNSSLSEFGCLGFELGYSMTSPHQLVLWEAQFGDFANNAQCIIDQFIVSGEQKWLQRTGLTLLLPHGYDGQGPEHSSARMERFLQLADEDPYSMPDREGTDRGSYARQHQDCNIQVVYPTVPSNYFHALRRQVHREFRKPLIVFESKALLRHPLAKSSIEEMGANTQFQRVIPEVLHENPFSDLQIAGPGGLWAGNNADPRLPYALSAESDFQLAPPNEIKTVIFCSGQVYYLLYRARALNNLRNVAIVRLEQLTPFPFWEVKAIVDHYGASLEEIVWAQEESFNSGAWSFVEPRMDTAIRETDWFKSGKGAEWGARFDSQRVAGGLDNGRKGGKGVSVRGGRLVRYAGRDISAAPATGLKKQHVFEEKMLVSEALLGGKLVKPASVEQGIPKFYE
ncbi:oxoglutarate dehydrogenase (succinyl-transferring), E1 component [Spizellomyces punctatus DAOM BR117]|uniref:2-oxoglutarate dehydrogenase, mitochondrial n=1 Tax=Spizellomyces punctatus (strain DAOM BR117) TaxID=645134 RepID=A0A0L0HEA4_SPIPD|nr:oxoglutarate dehydrogenase (succinyl-transferring), E1 component [Spizellomyces punctatus DAOM BR117]KNC99356.1 oxoglutarate dehydrogenase (succinyl-transferring), E1 component [Spizellomyces punctatus DAOM BR117]|eukprot:XP_016607396.1 oxoglutarate dehydrogenase (succinyl-transferring), E1 component [Spizellomyces punctatus DAOM BR117]